MIWIHAPRQCNAAGPVPFDPAVNRVFVFFVDANGVIRGGTSVAVRTL